FDVAGWRIGLQVISFENTYGLDPAQVNHAVAGGNRARTISAHGFTWAGGQERSPGKAEVRVQPAGSLNGEVELSVRARHPKKIRCTKLILAGLRPGSVIGRAWREAPLPEGGLILSYPRTLHTPLVFLRQPDGGCLYFRSTDTRVRCKRFAIYEAGGAAGGEAGAYTVELIHEDAAHEMTNETETPAWRIGRCHDPLAVVREHCAQVERAYAAAGLGDWNTRADVPGWMRQTSLVAALHGMHWSGYVFNTYDQMLDALEHICRSIEGRRVMAYLPGWEGRYYWQYGDYRPEPRLGGPAGFRRLVQGAHALGVKVNPMFGGNCANTGSESFEQWGAGSHLRSAGGAVFQGNKPDWDVARAHDTNWQAWLNPGAPGWRNRLLSQVSDLVETYGLQDDAVFFDTHHIWENDPDHPVWEGLVRLRDGLKRRFPGLLVTGESWYDALGAVTPVCHAGVPAQWAAEFFAPHNRAWSHLSTGDPSRGSTGVHELGTRPWQPEPLLRHHLPTLTVVDGTIEHAPERVQQVIATANEYAARFLGPSS
ncbi:MAG: DUF6259 domain-containing protein, partial [Chloroflexota bacterium]